VLARVLHITNAGGYGRVQLGGGERAVGELSAYFADVFGWDVGVVAPAEFLSKRTLAPSVSTFEEPFSLAACYRLPILISRFRPTVVVTHLLRATLVGQPLAALCRTPVRVSNLHNSLSEIQAASQTWGGAWRVRAYRAAFHAVTRVCSDATIAISAPNRIDLVRGDHLPRRLVRVIENWVSPAFFRADIAPRAEAIRARYHLDRETTTLGFVGRLEHQKNVEFAIRLLARIPKARLMVVGEGSEHDRAIEIADRLGLRSRIAFVGHQSDVAPWLAALDVLVMPSRFEGFGRVAAEAMAVGVPVVGSDTGGLATILRAIGEPGAWCVPTGDVSRWIAAIRTAEVAGRSEAVRVRLREAIASRYSLEAACIAYRELYADSLQHRLRSGRSPVHGRDSR
jgi:glycosyltransferase involved in cell wall biosynthesis